MNINFTLRCLFILILFSTGAMLTVHATGTSPDPGEVTTPLPEKNEIPLAACTPISTLDCNDIAVGLPFSLSFSGTEGGLLAGDNTSEIGFTMVQEPSARLAVDDPVFNPSVPGYEPSKLSLANGELTVTSTKGIFFNQPSGNPSSTETNSQLNALGVGFVVTTANLDVSGDLAQPDFAGSTGNNSQQAGLWFGLDEDHYIKLALIKVSSSQQKVQLQVENLSNPTAGDRIQELNSGNFAMAGVTTISLRLAIDPGAGTVAGFYSIDGGTEVQVQNGTLPVPASFLAGVDHDGNAMTQDLSYAGVFTTHRRAATSQSIDFSFSSFAIVEIAAPNTPPTASFTATPTDLTAYFDGTGSSDPDGTIASYSWDFGDGSGMSSLESPNYTYAMAGTYDVTLTVTDNEGAMSVPIIQSVTVQDPGAGAFPYRINFQDDPGNELPTGYLRDSGEPFGRRMGQDQGTDNLVYGWLTTDASTLLDLTGNGRNRGRTGITLLQNTLIHMQYGDTGGSNGEPTEGIWEMSVPNGSYEVTVSVGDQPNYDSEHRITVEGVLMIEQFQGTAMQEYETSTTTAVMVNDGRLTLTATGGGMNTKINAIVICSTTAPSCSTALPVTFSEWRGRAFDDRAELVWRTSAERDNRGFYVESSPDGRTFREIGFVPGNGDSQTILSYEFTDERFRSDTYYRLRQVDYDGAFEYSSVIFLKHPAPGRGKFQLYPNPVSDRVALIAPGSEWEESEIDASLYGVDGRLILRLRGTPGQLSEQLTDALPMTTGNLFWLRLVYDGRVEQLPLLR